jgi:hypothetical protein
MLLKKFLKVLRNKISVDPILYKRAKLQFSLGFQVMSVLSLTNTVILVVKPSTSEILPSFRWIYRLHLQSWRVRQARSRQQSESRTSSELHGDHTVHSFFFGGVGLTSPLGPFFRFLRSLCSSPLGPCKSQHCGHTLAYCAFPGWYMRVIME